MPLGMMDSPKLGTRALPSSGFWKRIQSTIFFSTLTSILFAIGAWMFEANRGWTSRVLARKPAPPRLLVVDARCNRIRLKFMPCKTSIFNRDEYEVQHIVDGEDESKPELWARDPWTEVESRVVAPLKACTRYKFRARTRNVRGMSEWSSPVSHRTLHRPVDGGAVCEGYSWCQNGVEVTISYVVPTQVTAKAVAVSLTPTHLKLYYTLNGEQVVLADQALPDRVRSLSPDGGSYWELDRDGGLTRICVVLEKEQPSKSIKWGFWRSAFVGHEEIDTHAIESDPHVQPMQPVSGMPGMGASDDGFEMHTYSKEEYEQLKRRVSGGNDAARPGRE